MKILEAQNALLTNYEVYQFLAERQARLAAQKHNRRRGPGNLETLIREVGDRLEGRAMRDHQEQEH